MTIMPKIRIAGSRIVNHSTTRLFPHSTNFSSGFTMIEVIVVLVLLGILTAVVTSRISSTSTYELAGEVEVVKTHLRYAQTRALADDENTWGIAFSSASYTLQKDGADAPTNLPGEDSATHNLPEDISCTTEITVTFDKWGSPGDSNNTITLDGSDITITQNTGFIP